MYGVSVPSTSGAGPVVGDRGEDLALSVHLSDTGEDAWFSLDGLEFLDHEGVHSMRVGSKSFRRDSDGAWQEIDQPDAGDV